MLAELGVDPIVFNEELDAEDGDDPPRSRSLRDLLTAASLSAREFDRGRDVGTEHLLAALLSLQGPAASAFERLGFDPNELLDRINSEVVPEVGPIALEGDIPPPILVDPREPPELARILDAAANRGAKDSASLRIRPLRP